MLHSELKLMKGVAKAIGDSNSPEQGILESISLLAEYDKQGFALNPTSLYWPQVAQLKNGGVWVDSAVADGRTLAAAARMNVIETINLNAVADTWSAVATQMVRLQRLAIDAESFWSTQAQIEPVYIKWHAVGAPGPQYALIYSIQIAQSPIDYNAETPKLSVTLTVEREAFWRAIPPGANPLQWWFESLRQSPGRDWNYTNLSLVAGTNHFKTATIHNRHEWNINDYLTPLSQNYVDIPASSIPGDAPALVYLGMSFTNVGSDKPVRKIFIGRSTKPTRLTARDADVIGQATTFNVGDSSFVGTKTTDANCGVIGNGSNTTKSVGTYTISASTVVTAAIKWASTSDAILDLNLNRGSYMAFLRCKQLTGSANDVLARLNVISGVGLNTLSLDWQYLPFFATAASTCLHRFGLLYMGSFTLPQSGPALASPDGRGLAVAESTVTVNFGIDLDNNAGATRNLEFLDLIIIPFDECAQQVVIPAHTGNPAEIPITLDSTGYTTHGQPEMVAHMHLSNLIDAGPLEVMGAPLTLIPNINNRLYFIFAQSDDATATTEIFSAPDATTTNWTLRLNIIPRWSGMRDK